MPRENPTKKAPIQHHLRLKVALITTLLLTNATKQQSQYPIYNEKNLADMNDLYPNMVKIHGLFFFKYEGYRTFRTNIIAYDENNPTTGELEHKISLLDVEYQYNDNPVLTPISRVGLTDALPYSTTIQKADQFSAAKRDGVSNLYYLATFNDATGTFKFYNYQLSEFSHPDLTNLPQTLHRLILLEIHIPLFIASPNLDFIVVHENKVKRISMTMSGVESFEDFPLSLDIGTIKHAEAMYGANRVIFMAVGDKTVFYSLSTKHLSATPLLLPDGEDDFGCERVEKPASHFYCFKSGSPVTRFTISGNTATFDPTYTSSFSLKEYYEFGTFQIVNSYYTVDSNIVFFVRGKKEDGRIGVSLMKNQLVEEETFIEDGPTEFIIQSNTNCWSCHISVGKEGKGVRVVQFASYTGVTNCFKGAEQRKYWNDRCVECIPGYDLDETGPSATCVKTCPAPQERFEAGIGCISCPISHHCSSCHYLYPICDTCLEGYEPNIPYQEGSPFCREKKCFSPSNHYWNGSKCVGCLEENRCESCEFPSGSCTQCSANHFLKLDGSDLKVCQPCGFFIEHCSQCSSTQECTMCEEGYKVDPEDAGRCVLEVIFYFHLVFSDTPNECDVTLRVMFANEKGEELDVTDIVKEKEDLGNLFSSYSETPEEELETTTRLTKRGDFEICLMLPETIKSRGDGKDLKIKIQPKFENMKPSGAGDSEENSLEVSIDSEIIKDSSETPSTFENAASQIPRESTFRDILSMLAICLDPGTAIMKTTQFMKLANRLVFLNINYGNKLTHFLETSADVHPDRPKEESFWRVLLEDPSYGKFTRYQISTDLTTSMFYKTTIYLLLWALKLLKMSISCCFGCLTPEGKDQKIEKEERKKESWAIWCWEKIEFSAFSYLSIDIIFYGGRVLIHKKTTIPDLDQLMIACCYFFIILDFYLVFLNMERLVTDSNIMLLRSEKNEIGDLGKIEIVSKEVEDEEQEGMRFDFEKKEDVLEKGQPRAKRLSKMWRRSKPVRVKGAKIRIGQEEEENFGELGKLKKRKRGMSKIKGLDLFDRHKGKKKRSKKSKKKDKSRAENKGKENEKENKKKFKKKSRGNKNAASVLRVAPLRSIKSRFPQKDDLIGEKSGLKEQREKRRVLQAFNINSLELEHLLRDKKQNDPKFRFSRIHFVSNLLYVLRMFFLQLVVVSLPLSPMVQVPIMMLTELLFFSFCCYSYKLLGKFQPILAFPSQLFQSVVLILIYINFLILFQVRKQGGSGLSHQSRCIFLVILGGIGEIVLILINFLGSLWRKIKGKNGKIDEMKSGMGVVLSD